MAIALKAICCRKKPAVVKQTVHNEIENNHALQKPQTQKPAEPNDEPCYETLSANQQPTSWRGKWSPGDYMGMTLFTVCLILIIIAPLLLENYPDWNSMFKTIVEEFHPFAYIVGK